MPTNFNWQTEEEEWGTLPEPTPAGPPHRRRSGRLLVLLAVLAASLTVYWQISRRVDNATASVAADLTASFEIMQRAQQLNDLELFRSVLSGRDPQWTRAQRDLFNAGLLFDRPVLGLTWNGLSSAIPPETILEEDLSAATLVTTHEYLTQDSQGVTTTVQLAVTQIYRTGSNRWLYAPPLTEFWGDWQNSEANYLEISAPARDAELVSRLTADLDQMLSDMCARLPELDCAAAERLPLRFSKDPAVIIDLQNRESGYPNDDGDLELPAPTLVGYPVDDDAYQALLRGYAPFVAATAIMRWASYDCCRHGIFFEALLDYMLADTGMAAWPLTPVVYDSLRQSEPTLQTVSVGWRFRIDPDNANDIRQLVYAGVEFLVTGQPAATPGDLLHSLDSYPSFYDWIAANTADTNLAEIESAWYAFVLSRSDAYLQPQPLPWPDQDVLLTCFQANDRDVTEIYRYRPENGELTRLQQFAGSGFAFPLPRGEGILTEAIQFETEDNDLQLIWKDGQTTNILPGAGLPPLMYFLGESTPDGNELLWIHISDADGDQTFSYLDLDTCRGQTSCQTAPMDGYAIWSPTGDHSLLLQPNAEGLTLWLGDTTGQQREYVATVWGIPFWIDNTRFGYFDEAGIHILSGPPGLAEVSITQEITREAFFAALPLNLPPAAAIVQVLASTNGPASLLIVISNGQSQQQYLVQYVLESGQSEILYQSDRPWSNVGLNQDGSFITVFENIAVSPSAVSQPTITVIDLMTRTTQQLRHSDIFFTAANWSDDNDWLVLALGNSLHFAVPGHGYQTIQFTGLSSACYGAFWTGRSD